VSNLSDLMPAGASGKTIEAVATATITTKKPVILNSAGTVTQIAETSVSEDIPQGAISEAEGSVELHNIQTAIDVSSDKVVLVARGASSYLNAIVGDINTSTGAITWGSLTVLNSLNSQYPDIVSDPNATGKFVVTFSSGHTQSKIALITVTGTTPAYAGELNIGSGTKYFKLAADPNTSQAFVAGAPDGSTRYINCVGITYSGTTFTVGSQQAMSSTTVEERSGFSIAFDQVTAGKFACAYRQYASPNYGYFVAGTISGTAVTPGTEEVFLSAAINTAAQGVRIAFDGNTADKLVVAYKKDGATADISAIGATLSGTDATWGTAVDDTAGAVVRYIYNIMSIPGIADTYYAVHTEGSSSVNATPHAVKITTTGTAVTFGTIVEIAGTGYQTSEEQGGVDMNRNDTGGFVLCWKESATNDSEGVYSQGAYTSSNLTSTNFVGIADAGISTSATGTIVVQGGTITGLSSLTAGSKYYVQNDGTITTVSSSVNAGLAISTTALLLNGDS
jgi:hypothetical protein